MAIVDSNVISVGMGEIIVSTEQYNTLVCRGLGSCIAVCAYDPEHHVAGMAHIVLPKSHSDQAMPIGRYADTAVPALVQRLIAAGAVEPDIRIVLCGGASLFPSITSGMDIGQRNIIAVRQQLNFKGLRIISEDIGGYHSRTVSINIETGLLILHTVRTCDKSLSDWTAGAEFQASIT